MASGAKVSDNVKSIYNEMKLPKGPEKDRLRLVIFDFINDCIDVKKTYRNGDLADKDVFDFFKTLLNPTLCHYILYDCHFQVKDSRTKEELVFVMWCPDGGTVKDKMHFSASRDVLKKALHGTRHNYEMTEEDDCGNRDEFAVKIGKGELVTALEGKAVKAPTGVRG